jgi:uncharacterized repeat protein (TIGR01451 family)
MKTLIKIGVLSLFAIAGPVWAGNLKLVNTAEMDVKTIDKNGKETVKRVPADRVVPGTEVIYTTVATNEETADATNVVLTNPIDQHMVYVDGSAISSAMGSATKILFSIDGSTFDKPEKLEVIEEDGTVRKAVAEDYKAVRWVCDFPVKPKGKVTVSFHARLK